MFPDQLKSPAFYVGILGGMKLILMAFGIDIITDEQVNNIANGFAALFTVIGVAATHKKKPLV